MKKGRFWSRIKQAAPFFVERVGKGAPPNAISRLTWREHVNRYAFAADLIPNDARVLDVAVGSGYGSKILLRRGGKSNQRRVVGVDISEKALQEAGDVNGLELVRASAEKLPFQNHSFDAVVSFETIEHLANPRALVSEAKRVLKKGGSFIVSTPVKEVYSPASFSPWNPFHVHEFRFFEFVNLLQHNFGTVELYGQAIPAGVRDYLKLFGLRFLDSMHARGLAKILLPKKFQQRMQGSMFDPRQATIVGISRKGPRPTILIAVCKKQKYGGRV